MRVLISLTPLIYREAIAHCVRQRRLDLEVRIAPPEDVEEEVRAFEPHLLVRSDADGIDPEVLAGVPCWVGLLYSESMDANIYLDGRVVEQISDISTDDLLRVADEAVAGTLQT